MALLDLGMDEEPDEGNWEQFRELMYFSLSFVSILWSFLTYKNKATVKKEPLFAINVVMYCKSLVSMSRATNR